jgi:hypothetical protein
MRLGRFVYELQQDGSGGAPVHWHSATVRNIQPTQARIFIYNIYC